ncbi:MAG: hypothetical protein MHM6MM_001376 [Cercozoa sp. M6MM]
MRGHFDCMRLLVRSGADYTATVATTSTDACRNMGIEDIARHTASLHGPDFREQVEHYMRLGDAQRDQQHGLRLLRKLRRATPVSRPLLPHVRGAPAVAGSPSEIVASSSSSSSEEVVSSTDLEESDSLRTAPCQSALTVPALRKQPVQRETARCASAPLCRSVSELTPMKRCRRRHGDDSDEAQELTHGPASSDEERHHESASQLLPSTRTTDAEFWYASSREPETPPRAASRKRQKISHELSASSIITRKSRSVLSQLSSLPSTADTAAARLSLSPQSPLLQSVSLPKSVPRETSMPFLREEFDTSTEDVLGYGNLKDVPGVDRAAADADARAHPVSTNTNTRSQ